MASPAVIIGVLAPAAATSGGIVFSIANVWFEALSPTHSIIH